MDVFGCSSNSRGWDWSEAADLSVTLCVFLWRQMKGCIKVLKEQPSNSVEGLLNALRCVSTHSETGHQKVQWQILTHLLLLLLLLIQVYNTTSKRWQHLQTNQGPPAMRERGEQQGEGRGKKEGARLKEEGNKRQWLIKLFVYNEQSNTSPG